MSERVKIFVKRLFCRHKETEIYTTRSHIVMMQVNYVVCKRCGKKIKVIVHEL